MNTSGWLQLGLYVVVLLFLAKPLGAYMAAVYDGRATWVQRIGGPYAFFGFKDTPDVPQALEACNVHDLEFNMLEPLSS